MRKKLEILAPAGSPEALRAAVENGADSVYLGGKEFSARKYASNFNREEIAKAVEYCHIRGVNVYVTVNTLIRNNEMERVLEFLLFLYNIGVDAVIVQDLGLIKAVKKILPDFTLHVSTQATVLNSSGVSFLKNWGIKRVILARELSFQEIKKIKEKTEAELEVFAHGALCFSFSGQCLMSSLIGGRSGNRGRCAQPCRLPYTLVDRCTGEVFKDFENFYFLSTRDLNLIYHIPELVKAGVSAIKIEGRMKRPEYVAVVVGIYRKVLDRYYKNPDKFCVSDEEYEQLAQIFNRDFTTGFFTGDPKPAFMSYSRPNNRGIFLGRITSIDKKRKLIYVNLRTHLSKGDGIEIWVTDEGRKGLIVKELYLEGRPVKEAPRDSTVEIPVPSMDGVRAGDRIFKTSDAELLSKAKETYTSPKNFKKIPLEIFAEVRVGKPLVLKGTDADGNSAVVETSFKAEKAVKRPLTEEFIREQLDRLGNTPFALEKFQCILDGQSIIPVSEINRARRELVSSLEQIRRSKKLPKPLGYEEFRKNLQEVLNISKGFTEGKAKNHNKLLPKISIAVSDLEGIKTSIKTGADRIYIGGEQFGKKGMTIEDIKRAVEMCHENDVEIYCALHRIWLEKEQDKIKEFVEKTLIYEPTGYTAGNYGSINLLKQYGVKNIHADYSLNVFNDQTITALLDSGVASYTLSLELSFKDLKEFKTISSAAECVAHGALPLMVSQFCFLGDVFRTFSNKSCEGICAEKKFGLKDRLNYIFPLESDSECRIYIFNSKELCMIENIENFLQLGIGYLRIEAKGRSTEYIKNTVGAYREAVDRYAEGTLTDKDLKNLVKKLSNFSRQGFTKGHYFRGVE